MNFELRHVIWFPLLEHPGYDQIFSWICVPRHVRKRDKTEKFTLHIPDSFWGENGSISSWEIVVCVM